MASWRSTRKRFSRVSVNWPGWILRLFMDGSLNKRRRVWYFEMIESLARAELNDGDWSRPNNGESAAKGDWNTPRDDGDASRL